MGIFSILIFCYWDKFYYVLKGKGNDYETFFYFLRNEECPIHKSLVCKCNKIKVENVEVQKYIDFYRYNSKLFSVLDGKITYIKKESKNSLKFSI